MYITLDSMYETMSIATGLCPKLDLWNTNKLQLQSLYCSVESMQAKFQISPPNSEIEPICITMISTHKVCHIYPSIPPPKSEWCHRKGVVRKRYTQQWKIKFWTSTSHWHVSSIQMAHLPSNHLILHLHCCHYPHFLKWWLT